MKKFFAWVCLLAVCLLAVCLLCGVVKLVDIINDAGTLPHLTIAGVVALLVGYIGFQRTK